MKSSRFINKYLAALGFSTGPEPGLRSGCSAGPCRLPTLPVSAISADAQLFSTLIPVAGDSHDTLTSL